MDYESKEVRMFLDSTMQLNRLRSCAKEPETVAWIEKYIEPGDVLYDIGANIGAYSLVAHQHCGGRISIQAFEPSFSNYYQLCRNVILNGCQETISPHMIALARESGVSVFNYQSVEAGTALHTLGASVDYRGEAFKPIYLQKVLSFSLDDLVFRYDFPVPNHIKLDVDGIELDILHGADKVLNDPRIKSIMVETCEQREPAKLFIDFLEQKGFRLESQSKRAGDVMNSLFIRTSQDKGKQNQADAIFVSN
jgi:FkbM family methyltransferase